MNRSLVWVWAFGSTLIAVLVLSLLPTDAFAPTTGWDKTNHVLAFSVLAYLGCRAFPRHLTIVLMGLLAYGGLIEVLQSCTAYRVGAWTDMVANGLGLPIGWFAQKWQKKYFE